MCGWKVSSEAKLKGDNYPPKLADWLWQFEPCFVRSISSFPGETEPKGAWRCHSNVLGARFQQVAHTERLVSIFKAVDSFI